MASNGSDAYKKDSPHQDLLDEGNALPSGGTNSEGGSAGTDPLINSMAAARSSKPATKRSTTKEDDPETQLKALRRRASLLVHDPSIRPEDRQILLRQDENAKALRTSEAELSRMLIQAQAEKDGRLQLVGEGRKLSRKPVKWLLEDLLIKDGTNLVYAEPKAGKTRFLLGALGALLNGEDEYLGKKLFDKGEKLFIAGPDMTQATWAEFLEDYRLADATGLLHERISDITCAGMNFRLNEEGIQLCEDQARANPGIVILIDAFASCMWGMGQDENKSTIADALVQLMNAVAQFRATLIVVHHANKRSSEAGITGGVRGSSAITAVVDQIVSMRTVRKPGTDEETGEVAIQTRGRASKPIALSVRQGEDGKSWESLGSPEQRQQAEQVAKAGAKLSLKQKQAMVQLCRQYREDKRPLGVTELCQMMGMIPKLHRKHVQNYVDGLIEAKGFVKKVGHLQEGKAKSRHLYLPTEAGREWYEQEFPAYPDS